MGAESSSNSGSDGVGDDDRANLIQTQVVLNVYDLTPLNNYMYWFGFGIFHSGIEVYGKEYGFGAHEFPVSGVFEVEPRKCPGFVYRSSISLGYTNKTPAEFRAFIEGIATEFHGDTYHLISKNCNHFTDDMSWRLTGKRIPGWVNRLAHLGAVCSCLLPESLQVTPVKQSPEYHEFSGLLFSEEDGSESLSLASPTPREPIEIDLDQEKCLLSPVSPTANVTFVKKGHR